MITIKELLDKIKWDKNERPEDYVLLYLDLGKLKELELIKVKSADKLFMTVEKDDGTVVEIPLHRIRMVKRRGETIWQR